MPLLAAVAAAGASSYAYTEIDQVVAVTYLDAFTKLVTDVKSMDHDVKADNVQASVTMAKPGKLYEEPNNSLALSGRPVQVASVHADVRKSAGSPSHP
jgi:hypothetical protein